MTETKRINITQPADWIDAWKEHAARNGYSLSEWIGVCCNVNLTASARKKLSERITRGGNTRSAQPEDQSV